MDFMKILDQLLKRNGISAHKMSVDLGLNKNAVTQWRDRGTVPNGETLIKLADYFDVSTDYLLGRAQKKETPAAPLSSEETELLEKFNAFSGIVKSHILRYLDLLKSETSSFGVSLLTKEQAEELIALIEETYPGHSTNSRREAR